ncbi:hypothetical protein MJO29_008656 [Puccinia striiformis f. sp. tritici]|nr:hypothetical protein MJO29_008656 [Puccinia striiformis f. sp. tritici]
MFKAALPALVAVTLGMLSVVRAVDLTDAYRYYPDGDLLHVDANAGSFKCPRNCPEFFRATRCTNNDVTGSKVTNETCSSTFGFNGAAHKTCGGFVNGKRHTYTCDHLDPASSKHLNSSALAAPLLPLSVISIAAALSKRSGSTVIF